MSRSTEIQTNNLAMQSPNVTQLRSRLDDVERQLAVVNMKLARTEAQLDAYADVFPQSATFGQRIAKSEKRIRRLTWQVAILLPVTAPIGAVLRLIYNTLRKFSKKRKQNKHLREAVVADGTSTVVKLASPDSQKASVRRYNTQGYRVPDAPNILLIKPDHIGDLFLAFPAVEALRTYWPDCKLTVVCAPGNIELAQNSGLFDEVRGFSFFAAMSENVKKPTSEIYSGITAAVPEHYDIAIDMRHDDDTRPLLGYVSADIKAGFDSQGARYTPLDISLPQIQQNNPLYKNLHNIDRLNLLVARIASALRPPTDSPVQQLVDKSSFANPLKGRPFAVLAPGAGTKAKKWSAQSYATLAKSLIDKYGLEVVVIGGPGEKEFADEILALAGPEHVLDLVGKLPLKDMPGAIDGAAVFIGNDTGATHLAALMGVPTIGIFSGVADINIWKPVGDNVDVIKATVACSPCHIARLEDCVANHICMTAITVDAVLEVVDEKLAVSRLRAI